MCEILKTTLWVLANCASLLVPYNAYTVGEGFFSPDVGIVFGLLTLLPGQLPPVYFVRHLWIISVVLSSILVTFMIPWGFITGSGVLAAFLISQRLNYDF